MTELSASWYDGFHAHNDGVPLSENPYGDVARKQDWRTGWLAAEQHTDALNVERQFREPPRG